MHQHRLPLCETEGHGRLLKSTEKYQQYKAVLQQLGLLLNTCPKEVKDVKEEKDCREGVVGGTFLRHAEDGENFMISKAKRPCRIL